MSSSCLRNRRARSFAQRSSTIRRRRADAGSRSLMWRRVRSEKESIWSKSSTMTSRLRSLATRNRAWAALSATTARVAASSPSSFGLQSGRSGHISRSERGSSPPTWRRQRSSAGIWSAFFRSPCTSPPTRCCAARPAMQRKPRSTAARLICSATRRRPLPVGPTSARTRGPRPSSALTSRSTIASRPMIRGGSGQSEITRPRAMSRSDAPTSWASGRASGSMSSIRSTSAESDRGTWGLSVASGGGRCRHWRSTHSLGPLARLRRPAMPS